MILERKWIKYVLMMSVVVGLVTSMFLTFKRVRTELKQDNVYMAMSYNDIQKWSHISADNQSSLLKRIISDAGVTNIALEESTIQDFVDAGKVTLLRGSEIINLHRVGHINRFILTHIYRQDDVEPEKFYLIIDEKADYEQIRDFLIAEYGKDKVAQIGQRNILKVLDDEESLLNTGVGIRADVLEDLQEIGFNVIVRLKNSPRSSENAIKQKLLQVKDLENVSTIIFDGDDVLGYPYKLPITIRRVEENNFTIGMVEFARQNGMTQLARTVPRHIIRVHSISQNELERLTAEKAVMRFRRAVNERRIELVFVHPFLTDDAIKKGVDDYNFRFLNRLQTELEPSGLVSAPIERFDWGSYNGVNVGQLFLLSVGVMAMLIILVRQFMAITWSRLIIIAGLFASVFYTNYLVGSVQIWAQGLATLSAIIFPTYAMIKYFPMDDDRSTNRINRIGEVLIYLLKSVGFSLIGALFIVGLLSDVRYLMGISLFFGVKMAFVLPVVLVAIYFYLRPHRLGSFLYVLKRLVLAPIRTSSLLAVMFIIGFILIYIMRSGNYMMLQIPVVETALRHGLENLFWVRPRTKEFMVGYPFLLLTYYYIDHKMPRTWLWFFNMMGVVALISLINSFCHLHTPFLVSLYRSAMGVLLGIGVAIMYVLILRVSKYIIRQLK